ncbi:MAG: hypothetical protein IPO99_00315 [Nitrospira sp.]|nr:hypothetical protein [Nitrospira sp.]
MKAGRSARNSIWKDRYGTGVLADVGRNWFDRGTIVLDALRDPIHEAFVTLRFDQDKILIPRLAFHVGESDLRISGSIAQWAESPKARLVIESSQVDIAAFLPSPQPSSESRRGRFDGKSWWSEGRVDAFFFADHLYYKKFLVTDLSGSVVDHGPLTVERISGDTQRGACRRSDQGPVDRTEGVSRPGARFMRAVSDRARLSSRPGGTLHLSGVGSDVGQL